MLTVREIFERVRKDDSNSINGYYENLAESLGIEYYFNFWEDDFSRLSGYWLAPSYCTDEWVGQRAYFFDGEPLALSIQKARKSSENFWFVSEEAAQKVRMYFYDIIAKGGAQVNTVSMDTEVPDTYTVDYPDQFIDRKGFYKGEPCEVVKVPNVPGAVLGGYVVDITLDNGSTETVRCADIKIPLRIT